MTHKCSVCSKDADLTCKFCKGTPDGAGGLVAVYYCHARCEKKGWKAHQPSCRAAKDRRALYRAGDIAQALYHILHRNTWMWPIEKIERNGNEWLVFDGEYIGKSLVMPFPIALFPTAEDQKAILSHSGCNGAVAHMHNPIKDLLKDIYSDINEVIVRVKNPSLRILRRQGTMIDPGKVIIDMRNQLHNVLRVTLKNGEVYALDMTGPQFGWHGSTVMPWSAFFDNRVDIPKEIRDFGATAQIIKAEAQAAAVARINIQHINEEMDVYFYHYLKQWQKDNASLKAMLRWTEDEFKTKQDSLLAFMNERMLEVKAHALKTGFFDILTGKPPMR